MAGSVSERQAGWYWIKTIEHAAPEYWEPAFFSNGEWDHDLSVKVVGPRIPTPDETEGWQLVPVEATADMMEVLTLGNHVTAPRRWRDTLAVAPTPD